jgi:protein TonB
MDPKKNPKVDLVKNSALYFAIGLCLVLFLSWKLVEHKTYEKSSIDIGMLTVNEDEIEEVPLTEQLKTPPPPPPPAVVTQVLEVVKDEEEVEETVIESTETTQEEIIEDVPLFPGCERVKKSERRKCFQEKMDKHVFKISATLKLLKKWVFKDVFLSLL